MASARLRFVYWVVLPMTLAAIGVLAYYSLQTAAQFERLGEQSIADSSLSHARDKVGQLERLIIAADNRVFSSIDLERLNTIDERWRTRAEQLSPSVRAVAVLNGAQQILALSSRTSADERGTYSHLLRTKLIADLELESLEYNRLKHLHRVYDDKVFLISYKAIRHRGQRLYVTAHHDVGYLVREVFPELFSLGGEQLLNVIDGDNQRVFGANMTDAGDYVVAYRFPTTLYGWRLQVAPRTAPLLEAKGRTSRFNQFALIALCLAIILVAVLVTAYVADKERRLATLKSEFIANVTHELKTPLSVIRMFSEMLLTQRVSTDEKRQEYLNIICSESERLSSLIQNVLDFAALERGKQRYAMADSDVGELVGRAIEAFRYRFEREGSTVKYDSSGDTPLGRVDEQSILLAVINLLDNAVKYGAGTTVEVGVHAGPEQITISVRDHGGGIPRADLKRVFDRFYRTGSDTTVRGSGIGLSLVKHIAEAHHGRAWAENAQDGGAIVSITIPRRDPTRPRTQTTPPIDSAPATDIVTEHV